MRASHLLAPVTLALALASASLAHATRYGKVVGAGCVPDDLSVQADRLSTAGFGVKFKGTATGKIRLICPVIPYTTGDGLTINRIVMFYKDPDGMSTTYRIRAHLRTVAANSNGMTTIATVDSDTNSSTGYIQIENQFEPDITMVDNDLYWIEVEMDRSSSALQPEFVSAHLVNTDI